MTFAQRAVVGRARYEGTGHPGTIQDRDRRFRRQDLPGFPVVMDVSVEEGKIGFGPGGAGK
jgi:hypothetical protein